jgi:single-strand DNA-binding protein
MSYDINTITIVGRLTRDVELSYTSNTNTPVCKFSIANNNGKKDTDESVSYFDIVAWNKTAEICSQYLKKGSQVVINGRISQSRFTDKNGQNRSKVEIIASSVQFVGGKPEGQQNSNQEPGYDPRPDPFDIDPFTETEGENIF